MQIVTPTHIWIAAGGLAAACAATGGLITYQFMANPEARPPAKVAITAAAAPAPVNPAAQELPSAHKAEPSKAALPQAQVRATSIPAPPDVVGVPPSPALRTTPLPMPLPPSKTTTPSGTQEPPAAPAALAVAQQPDGASEARSQSTPTPTTQTAQSSPAKSPAFSGLIEQKVTMQQAGIAAIDPGSVRFNSGRIVSIGERFPSGETLLSVDPAAGRVMTNQRAIQLITASE